jgi:hypothetical protein
MNCFLHHGFVFSYDLFDLLHTGPKAPGAAIRINVDILLFEFQAEARPY